MGVVVLLVSAIALPGSFQSAFRALLDDTSYTGAVREVRGRERGGRYCYVTVT